METTLTQAESQLFPGEIADVERFIIAIDGGGTGTRAGLYDESGTLLGETTGQLTNPYQTSVREAAEHISAIALALMGQRIETPALVVAGISGARSKSVRDTFARTLCERTKAGRVIVTTDIHAQLLGNAERSALAVVSGTGSCVVARDTNDEITLFGGRGPRLGDDGSAYDLVITALRAAHRWADEHGERPELLRKISRGARAESDEAIVAWSLRATKEEIAAHAEKVVELAEAGDTIALASVTNATNALASIAHAAAHRVELGRNAPIFVSGGMFENSLYYRKCFEHALQSLGTHNKILLAPRTGHRAVFELARQVPLPASVPHSEITPSLLNGVELTPMETPPDEHEPGGKTVPMECLSSVEIIARMHLGDVDAVNATVHCRADLAMLVNRIVVAFRNGGRLIYVGAGTSGRLGVLDASECPPTFGVPPGKVIGIIAGGDRALRESIEGAEDDIEAAFADIEAIEPPVGPTDVGSPGTELEFAL